nr:MAG TPA: hypothetical protein [Caudoviricetes sp.]
MHRVFRCFHKSYALPPFYFLEKILKRVDCR